MLASYPRPFPAFCCRWGRGIAVAAARAEEGGRQKGSRRRGEDGGRADRPRGALGCAGETEYSDRRTQFFSQHRKMVITMERTKLAPFDCAKELFAALPKGVLLTTKAGDKVNSMVIGWGTLGIEWQTPVFIAFVREHRYTREMLDKNPEFTVNVPVGAYDKKIIGVCGGKSGRNLDKVQAAGLTLVEPEVVSVPAVREFPLTLECRVVYRQQQDLAALTLAPKLKDACYPQDVDSSNVGANRDAHIAYYGEIVSAYLLK